MSEDFAGFDAMSKYPLFEALHKRRSRRIGLGLKSVPAGSNTYTSNAAPQPLSELEEAILISATGLTGITLPDRPFEISHRRENPRYAELELSRPRRRQHR